MSTIENTLELAKERLSVGEHQECLRLISHAIVDSPDNKDCYILASLCLKQMNADAEAVLFDRAISSWQEAEPFFQLGYHFIDAGHDRLAIPLLQRAFSLDPGNSKIGLELSIALSGRFQPEAAREVLLACDLSSNFWLAYQLYWTSLLCGIVDGAEQFIRESRRFYLSQSATQETKGALYALDKLDELRLRLLKIKEPQRLIRDWHFLQYGSAILDYFDDRDGQQGLQVAGGRFVYVGVSYQQLSITLSKLKHYLSAMNKTPQVVLCLPDRDSCIIAGAAASILKLPLKVVDDSVSGSQEESLLIAASNQELAGYQLEKVLKGQTVFAFNLNWLTHGPVTPDVIGLMSQYCIFPWSEGRLELDPETSQSRTLPEDPRPETEISAEFDQEVELTEEDFQALLEFYKSNTDLMKGGRLGGSKRWRFITDSPVPGSYFA